MAAAPDGGKRFVVHFDADAFYASAEIARDPALRDVPLVVGAEPEARRTVVLTANYVARKFGIRSGMPTAMAKRLCPDAVFVPPDFEYYEKVSAMLMDIIRKRSGRFEQLSIDEGVADISGRVSSLEQAKEWVAETKKEIVEATSLTVSAGISGNKSSAKIAADMQKPDGMTAVEPGGIVEFLAPLPVTDISGVGPKTANVLAGMNIWTIGELRKAGAQRLHDKLGKNGAWLWEVANGTEKDEIAEQETKSIGVEKTLEFDIIGVDSVNDEFPAIVDELARRIQAEGVMFKEVGIKVKYRNFEVHSREKRLVDYTVETGAILRTASDLFAVVDTSRPIRLLGVKVALLKKREGQPSLEKWQEG